MNFKKLELDNIEEVEKFFIFSPINICDFTTGGLFMWREFNDTEYAIEDNSLFLRFFDNENVLYSIPLSSDINSALHLLFKEMGNILSFVPTTEECFELFNDFKIINSKNQEDLFDYIYNTNDLINLSGRKYQKIRNHINSFNNNYKNYEFEEINHSNISLVKDFFLNRFKSSGSDSSYQLIESDQVIEVIDNYDIYNFKGLCLKIDNKVEAFSYAEIRNNTCFIHIEKANKDFNGIYQKLFIEFLNRFCPDISFINREEDMGDIGLRTAKERYHPVKLLHKYILQVEDNAH